MDARVAALLPAMTYLEGDVEMMAIVTTLGRLTRIQHGVSLTGRDALEAEALAEYKAHIARYLSAAFYDACGTCHQPVVTFMDGRALAWPSLELHSHEPEGLLFAQKSAQNAIPMQRKPPTVASQGQQEGRGRKL